MLDLESAYDDFLNQADAFNLDISQAVNIWSRRVDRILLAHPRCDAYTPLLETELAPDEEPEPDEPRAEHKSLLTKESSKLGVEEAFLISCVHCWRGYCLLETPECKGVCPLFER